MGDLIIWRFGLFDYLGVSGGMPPDEILKWRN